mgnify:CR=1 FL=1
MRNQQNFENDIAVFFERYDELKQEDRKRLLMSIFNTHILLNESELVIGSSDFHHIICMAKNEHAHRSLPIKIEKYHLDNGEMANLSVMEAFIGFLNQKGALRRFPKFNK